ARAGRPVRVPRSRRARDPARRADRASAAADVRADVTRELGLGLQTDKRPGDYAALAWIAEVGGFDVVTTFNALWYQTALPPLLEIAGTRERVRVGSSCLKTFTAPPIELAGQTAMLDLVSGGRAFVGLAAGAWLEELGIQQRRPAAAVAEAWEIV